MSRYIDADALLEKAEQEQRFYGEEYDAMENGGYLDEERALVEEAYRTMTDCVALINNAPTVDAVPVVHGEWTIDGMNEYELSYGCIGYEPRYRCSRCGITTESYLRTEKPIMPEDADFPNYCPNCGAKMDGMDGLITMEQAVDDCLKSLGIRMDGKNEQQP